ncbi:uncharacterized protein PGTG_09791 [Puccinia graminis f. sp. tritici CRL 75-36-700-3]|uniref:Uncharacterized protein n=1 Tax=Puccinia graminis f. sp. tritici (strain CRL 75-36-700-3 / race SCCL) TaxID=418459 RepID=E3KEU8_PUCGT|nr:uncharacterized protein PGTG_09791 [Puccinia graminis f. sp. tritici CRL 75-36-700-3]EFP82823.2 hypothetical protein PGTG_09791 [Puccinia graminis f. sp. tritici CRL 75-36-700-3]
MPRDSTPYNRKAVRTSARLGGPQQQIEPAAPDINLGENAVRSILKQCETQIQQKFDPIAAKLEELQLVQTKRHADHTQVMGVKEKENSEINQTAQGDLCVLQSNFDKLAREVGGRMEKLSVQMRNQYANDISTRLAAFKTGIEAELDSTVHQAILHSQHLFRQEIEQAVAIKDYATTSSLQNQAQLFSESFEALKILSQSNQAEIARVSSVSEAGCSTLQESLSILERKIQNDLSNNQRVVEEKLLSIEAKNSSETRLEQENRPTTTEDEAKTTTTRQKIEQIEKTIGDQYSMFQCSIVSAHEELKAKYEEILTKLNFRDSATESNLQDIKGKLHDALKRISDLEEKALFRPADQFLQTKGTGTTVMENENVATIHDLEAIIPLSPGILVTVDKPQNTETCEGQELDIEMIEGKATSDFQLSVVFSLGTAKQCTTLNKKA